MLVFADGTTEGTIGGGWLEAHAVARAREMVARGGTQLETVDITDRGFKCGGGRATLFYEALGPEAELVIVGAGHVARAVARLAQEVAAFPVTVHAGRAEEGEVAPGVSVHVIPGYSELPPLGQQAYVVICTDSHATDLAVATQILRQQPGPAYVGMLGSQTKSAEIRAALRDAGIPAERVAILHCPVGLPIGGRSPGLVALSILAEIVAFHHGRLGGAEDRLRGREF